MPTTLTGNPAGDPGAPITVVAPAAGDALASGPIRTLLQRVMDQLTALKESVPAALQTSESSSNFNTTSASATAVTGLSVTITATGRPVRLMLIPDGSAGVASIMCGAPSAVGVMTLLRDGVVIASFGQPYLGVGTGGLPPGAYSHIDQPAAGAHTYTVKVQSDGTYLFDVYYVKLAAYEIG